MRALFVLLCVVVLAAADLAGAAAAEDAAYEQAQSVLGPLPSPDAAAGAAAGAGAPAGAEAAVAAAPVGPEAAAPEAAAAAGAPAAGAGAQGAPPIPASLLQTKARAQAAIHHRLLAAARSQRRMQARFEDWMLAKRVAMNRELASKMDALAATQAQLHSQLRGIADVNVKLVRGHQLGRELAAKQRQISETTQSLIAQLDQSVQQQHQSQWSTESAGMQAQDTMAANEANQEMALGNEQLQATVEGDEALARQETTNAQAANGEMRTLEGQMANMQGTANMALAATNAGVVQGAQMRGQSEETAGAVAQLGAQGAMQQAAVEQRAYQQQLAAQSPPPPRAGGPQ